MTVPVHSDEKETYDGQPTTGYHGYGAIDFYGVEEHFGDLKKFRELEALQTQRTKGALYLSPNAPASSSGPR